MDAAISQNTAPNREGMPKVVGLIRVSTAGQAKDDRAGIARQRAAVRQTIERRHLDCSHIFELADCSGTEVLRHPDILQILTLVESRMIDGVVTADLDRLFRPDNWADYSILQLFKEKGAKIFCPDTVHDLATKDGMLFAGIRSSVAGFELGLMKERQHGAKEEKRRKGECPTNPLTVPLGVAYDRHNRRWHYTEGINTVIELFRLYDDGVRNFCELGRRFNLNNRTVRNLLSNALYKGYRVYAEKRGEKRTSKTGKTYRVKVPRTADETITVKVMEGIVTEEHFERVQVALRSSVANHESRLGPNSAVNLGAGIARCARCGEPLFCSSGKRSGGLKRQGYYFCRANYYLHRKNTGGCPQPNIRQAWLDEAIFNLALNTISDAPTLEKLVTETVERSRTVIAFPAKAAEQIAGFRRREKRLLDALEAGEISIDELRERRARLKKSIQQVEKTDRELASRQAIDIREITRLAVQGAFALRRIANDREKKAVLHALLAEVHVRDFSIVALKFREDLLASPRAAEQELAVPIELRPAINVGPQLELLPPGQKRCIRCNVVREDASFSFRLNRCRDCIREQEKQARLRRLERKDAKNEE